MDSIPKEGGNRFTGAYRYFLSNGSLQNNNVPDELRQFIRAGDELRTSWNSNVTVGGPIMQNRLWFFNAFRLSQTDSYVSDMVLPNGQLLRLANGERVNRDSRVAPNGTLRLTTQLTGRDNHKAIAALNLNNGAPVSVTVRNTPVERLNELRADSGVFVQDRWTMTRLTIFGGARYDWFSAGWPDQYAPANPFVPERRIPQADCQPCWNDWSIRAGASFDLFGNGKTAIKTSIGKFFAANALGTTSSLNPLGGQSNTRQWRDLDGNHNVIDAAGNVQFNEIGATTNINFGLPAGSLRIDPNLKRGNNWEESVSVQHELFRRMAVTVGYYRRQFYNQTVERNFAVDPDADYTAFTVTGPVHPNLPDGGGERITLYNLNPNKQGQVNTIRINSPGRSRVYSGIEMSLNARFPGGFAFGGITTEREAVDSCADLSNPNSRRFCDRLPPFRSLFKASAGYMLPYAVQIAGSFQARPGIPLGAEWTISSAVSVANGGVPLTGGVSSITVDLMDPEKYFYDYVYTNDMTVSRIFRINRARIRAFAEMFNVANLSTIYTRQETFGAQCYNPIDLVQSRRFQFGFQMDW